MSKKKKNRNKINGNWSYIEHNILNSEAWKGLKIHTKWLYFEFKIRWHTDNTRNIIFTYQEAKNIMAIDTFIKSRNKLIERGFIDVIKRGGLEKQSAIYGLSDRWKKYGTKDFVKVDLKKILPKIFKTKFKKGHKFMGNRFKKK
ncbi:hypothetical protein ES695_02845 [Candidatus Atribacteria bacterium 1244-E10-H5-B2]|nr:MAG: hypothetical protein ES695_02845 [Candidatus Atribacteria bacterium 1244-E10-H5-B2]